MAPEASKCIVSTWLSNCCRDHEVYQMLLNELLIAFILQRARRLNVAAPPANGNQSLVGPTAASSLSKPDHQTNREPRLAITNV
jgi:hypothetical protein